MRQDITIADGTVVHTLDAFPFDSSPNLVTTVQGYRRGDRAVDAWTMQRTFAQFFSDGVFGTPADAFQIGKASSGLAVTIQPGMAVINGGMGGIKESDGAMTLTLDTGAVAGNVCYGIMLRYDNNSDVRSLGIRAVKGVAGSNPQPPAPDTTSAGVMELRLGYVTVPNGATDLSNATVTNEKGLDVCPYAAPFVPLDISHILLDIKNQGSASLAAFSQFLSENIDFINSALDDTTAGNLQAQINELQNGVITSENIDNDTLEFSTTPTSGGMNRLRVKDGGIGTDQIEDLSVTAMKLDADLQVELGVMDTTGWTAEQYASFVGGLSSELQVEFIGDMDFSVMNSWDSEERAAFVGELGTDAQKAFMQKIDLSSTSWADLQAMSDACSSAGRSVMLGKSKTAMWNGSSRTFTCVSVDHYSSVKGLIFILNQSTRNMKFSNSGVVPWNESAIYDYVTGTWLSGLDGSLSSILKQVPVPTHVRSGSGASESTVSTKAWSPSASEINGTSKLGGASQEGSQYQLFSKGTYTGVSGKTAWTRTAYSNFGSSENNGAYYYNGSGSVPYTMKLGATYDDHDVLVCFCI